MNSDVITTRADLEQHLIAIMAALDEQERKTGTPTAAVFVRLMRAIYPVFMRAVDDECRDGVAPNDLLTAIETLVCNMLEYAISISATPGHEIDLAAQLVAFIGRDLVAMLSGHTNRDGIDIIKVPRTRAS
jgi:hypothetical protein